MINEVLHWAFVGILVVLAVAVAISIYAVITAAILQWRAAKLASWSIPYKEAFILALKACGLFFAAFGMAGIVVWSIFSDTELGYGLIPLIGLVVGSIVWFLVHSSVLLKFSGETFPITVEKAREITWSVLGYSFGLAFVIALVQGLVSR